jgi:GT2 family glycosyltransferase
LVIDNDSNEQTARALFDQLTKEDRRVQVLSCPGEFNYSALNNFGARAAKGEILVLLNNDIVVIAPDWLRELVSQAIRPDVGIVGAKLIYANEKIQHAGVVLAGSYEFAVHAYRCYDRSDPGYFGQLALTRTVSAVTGACMAIRRNVFFEVGGLDEVNLPVSYNDVDLCLRTADFGYRVLWTPFAELFHLESSSRGKDDTPAKQQLALREFTHMRKWWRQSLEHSDPFHNPNVLFTSDAVEIPSAPRRIKPWYWTVEQIVKGHQHLPFSSDIFYEAST